MDNPERRRARRYLVQVPLNFRPRHPSGQPKQFAEMLDVSPTGASFLTKAASPSTGSPIELFLRMPPEVLGRETAEWLWVGAVVHSHPSPANEEWTIVGVKFSAALGSNEQERMETSLRASGEISDGVRKSIPAHSVESGQPNAARRETPPQRANGETKAPVRKWSRFDISGRKIP